MELTHEDAVVLTTTNILKTRTHSQFEETFQMQFNKRYEGLAYICRRINDDNRLDSMLKTASVASVQLDPDALMVGLISSQLNELLG